MGVDTGKKKSAEPACSRGSASEEKLQAARGKKQEGRKQEEEEGEEEEA